MTKTTKPFEPRQFTELMIATYGEDDAFVTDKDWEHVKAQWPGYGKTWRVELEKCAKGKPSADAADPLDDARKKAGRRGDSDKLFIKLAARVLWAKRRIQYPLEPETKATEDVVELLKDYAAESTVYG